MTIFVRFTYSSAMPLMLNFNSPTHPFFSDINIYSVGKWAEDYPQCFDRALDVRRPIHIGFKRQRNAADN